MAEAEEHKIPLVVENGSFKFKAGFAGQDTPSVECRSVVGHLKPIMINFKGSGIKDYYVGNEAMEKRGILLLKRPFEQGVSNWDDLEKIWNHLFHNELKVSPEDHPLLITEIPCPVHPQRIYREKMVECMFETLKIPSVYVALPAVLALYSSGCLTGVGVDLGHDVSHVVPIYEGNAISHGIIHFPVVGNDLTNSLHRSLQKFGHSFVTNAETELVRDVKEKMCYVAFDYEKELRSEKSNSSGSCKPTYELPDGKVVTFGNELFQLPEGLYKPSLMRYECDGIHQICYQSIMKCDKDIHNALGRNIVLCGGSSMFSGMAERFDKEMTAYAPELTIKTIAPPDRNYSAWKGGSMLASLPTLKDLSICKKEYEEHGPAIVHSKCSFKE